MNSSKSLEQTISDLKLAIDLIDSGYKNTRDLILDVARILDESGQCERRSISRKIKELLADKIQEGKITAKWIHDCLPSEYKREYKREVTSLSTSNTKNMNSRSDGTVIVQEIDGNAIGKNDESIDYKEETKKIVMDVEGIHSERRNLEKIPSRLFSTTGYNSIANTENALKPDLECSSCRVIL